MKITGVRVTLDTLRHTFPTHELRAGGDQISLQTILVHRRMEMARRYVHFAERDVRLRHWQFN